MGAKKTCKQGKQAPLPENNHQLAPTERVWQPTCTVLQAWARETGVKVSDGTATTGQGLR